MIPVGSPYPQRHGSRWRTNDVSQSYPQDAGMAPAVGMDPSLPSVPVAKMQRLHRPGHGWRMRLRPRWGLRLRARWSLRLRARMVGAEASAGGTCGACLGGGCEVGWQGKEPISSVVLSPASDKVCEAQSPRSVASFVPTRRWCFNPAMV